MNDDRIGGPEVGNRHPIEFAHRLADGPIHREHEGVIGGSGGALSEQVEVPELDYFVPPELEAHRVGHPEAVDVEDSAANAELGDILDHRHALEANGLEVCGKRLRPARVTLAQLGSRGAYCAGQSGPLE
jgi:hypothetical protein